MNLHRPISDIMTTELLTVNPLSIMTDVAEVFERQNIHHIPVVTKEMIPVGMISRHDYLQLQHHFTKEGLEMAEAANVQLYRSMMAKDVMTPNPVSMEKDELLLKAVNIFLSNRIHSILIKDGERCVGIVTPYDLLKEMKKLAAVAQ